MLITSLALSLAPVGDPIEAQPPRFADPIPFTTAGAPFEGMIYPSPALHDLDGDGKKELYLGDLWGHVWAASPASAEDVTAFGEHKKLERGEEPLKLNNW